MENLLIITIHVQDLSWEKVEQILVDIFESEPISISLPINPKLTKMINSARGKMRSYKLFFGEKNYENAVFELLIKLEEFGINWQFRKPIKVFPPKYMFAAGLFPEYGTFLIKDIVGISLVFFEGREDY